jgi:hypothetical protein
LVGLGAILSFCTLSAQQAAPSYYGSSTSVREISLEELTFRARTIVLGRLEPIVVGAPEQLPGLDLRKITVSPEEILKGRSVDGKVVVYQRPGTIEREEKDEVLWFIAEPNDAGLSAPLGFKSGDFRVTLDPKNHRRMAENLFGNHGLWSTKLWSRYITREMVKNKLTGRYSTTEVDEILELGDRSCPPVPVPYDLIAAFVRAKLDVMH